MIPINALPHLKNSMLSYAIGYGILYLKQIKTLSLANGFFASKPRRYHRQNKARLVAKGFHQWPSLDFAKTFSPVMKPTTIRVFLCLTLSKGWPLRQLDINNAFLHDTVNDNVYMVQPPGFVNSTLLHYECKLCKAIYGLKKASHGWYQELKGYLLQFGFINSVENASLFLYSKGTIIGYFLVYVDDIILTGNNSSFLEAFVHQLGHHFSLKDLGHLHHFLSVEVIPIVDGIFSLSTQAHY
ncbi:Retrovirus-related Pol polyprotein from transposon TNT 1-94 [Quillaja saponaria]|uniref:Retrovirus-related Pol polyprotein from transposon TNT 1-94 n=1 Tax=Quillaja saponaria TaxID=32244 RepID=A0AAD7KMU7_QUISA|nr:Retrovirus-related Pol polyprotein from transposon TNT 1-94 [Quillaja saponaria]